MILDFRALWHAMQFLPAFPAAKSFFVRFPPLGPCQVFTRQNLSYLVVAMSKIFLMHLSIVPGISDTPNNVWPLKEQMSWNNFQHGVRTLAQPCKDIIN